ncbi:hypothetical protein FQA39_LY19126 [Lamprigera yunnana]|nr:hypothetical protein FQA39_LY19126 [Lamprigera yunnana]
MSRKPVANHGRLCGAVVVHRKVQRPFAWVTLASMVRRNCRNSLLRWRRWSSPITSPVAMCPVAGTGFVVPWAHVVVRSALGDALGQRQDGLRAIAATLDLALCPRTTRPWPMSAGSDTSYRMSRTLLHEQRMLESLKRPCDGAQERHAGNRHDQLVREGGEQARDHHAKAADQRIDDAADHGGGVAAGFVGMCILAPCKSPRDGRQVDGVAAKRRQHQGGQAADADELGDGWAHRPQHARVINDVPQPQRPDAEKPQHDDGPEELADTGRAALLHHKQHQQHQQGDGNHPSLEVWRHHLQPLDGREHRDRRGDDAIAIEQAGAKNAQQHQRCAQPGPVFDALRRQRQHGHRPAFAVVVGAQHQHHVFERDDEGQRPEKHRQHAIDVSAVWRRREAYGNEIGASARP